MHIDIYPSGFEPYFKNYPLTLADVGASGGVPSHWAKHNQYLRVLGFEPDKRAFDELQHKNQGNTRIFNVALHSREGEIPFYLTRKQMTSSCFLPNIDFLNRFHKPIRFEVIKKTNLKCAPLDSVLNQSGIDDLDFIKSDTQGAELDILKGAASYLKDRIFGIELEAFFTHVYENAPLFPEIDVFLRQLGYNLIDMRMVSWKRAVGAKLGKPKGQLIQADVLYFREPSNLRSILVKKDKEISRGKLLRALAICQLYGYFDYAVELVDLMADQFFNGEELQQINDHIHLQGSKIDQIPAFPGRQFVYQLFRKLTGLFQPQSHRFKQRYIGNR